jgi:DNA ligase 1
MPYLPWLYYKDSHGTLRQWTVGYDENYYQTFYGAVGGQLITSDPTYCYATNVGRSNMRSENEQAKFEAEALWRNKKERRYRETPEEAAEELFLPMLAAKFEDRRARLRYPVYVQPKLDGVRCLAYWAGDDVALMSRSGKPYDVPHISDNLRNWLPRDAVLDGELYCHGMACQTITSLVRGDHPEQREQIEYWVYDVPVCGGKSDQEFDRRNACLSGLFLTSRGRVRNVPTTSAHSHDSVQELQLAYVKDGFEGAMVRTPAGRYKFGRRSNDLLKVKTFQDGEFVVLDWKDGEGKLAECCVFQCRNDINSLTFWCMPKGTIDQREEYARNARSYVGRKLTVRFFDRTEDGLPRFPVGVVFRDEKDLPNGEEAKD